MIFVAIFFVAVYLVWHLGKPKKYSPEVEPDEPWPRAPGLDTEAGKRWEAEQKRKGDIKYAEYRGKKIEKKGKGNRKGPADRADR